MVHLVNINKIGRFGGTITKMKRDIFPPYTPYERSSDLAEVHNLSGGRSSAFTWLSLINGGFGSQPNHYTLFENTGEEHETCYIFLKELEENTGVTITWLEYSLTDTFIYELIYSSFSYEKFKNCEYTNIGQILNIKKLRAFNFVKSPNNFWYKQGYSHPKNSIKEVNFETASRNGKPFIDLFLYKCAIRIMKGEGILLPSVGQRWCTGDMKEKVGDRWLALNGVKEFISYKGMRYDEPDRVRKVYAKNESQNDIIYEAPLNALKIKKIDVLMAWAIQPFDLGKINGVYTFIDAMGNCIYCHLKKKIKKLYLIQQGYKSRTLKQMERIANNYNGDTDAMSRQHGTYEILEKEAMSIPEITLDEVLSDEEVEISCFNCGD